MSIGNRIRNIRRAKRLSQGELGKRIGKNTATVSRYERNLVRIKTDVLQRIAYAMEIPVQRLYEGQEPWSFWCSQKTLHNDGIVQDITKLLNPMQVQISLCRSFLFQLHTHAYLKRLAANKCQGLDAHYLEAGDRIRNCFLSESGHPPLHLIMPAAPLVGGFLGNGAYAARGKSSDEELEERVELLKLIYDSVRSSGRRARNVHLYVVDENELSKGELTCLLGRLVTGGIKFHDEAYLPSARLDGRAFVVDRYENHAIGASDRPEEAASALKGLKKLWKRSRPVNAKELLECIRFIELKKFAAAEEYCRRFRGRT